MNTFNKSVTNCSRIISIVVINDVTYSTKEVVKY
jgi:hypothetical protein